METGHENDVGENNDNDDDDDDRFSEASTASRMPSEHQWQVVDLTPQFPGPQMNVRACLRSSVCGILFFNRLSLPVSDLWVIVVMGCVMFLDSSSCLLFHSAALLSFLRHDHC